MEPGSVAGPAGGGSKEAEPAGRREGVGVMGGVRPFSPAVGEGAGRRFPGEVVGVGGRVGVFEARYGGGISVVVMAAMAAEVVGATRGSR